MIVKNAKGVPKDQVTADLILFFQTCSLLKLNPLLKHIHAIYRKDEGVKKLAIQVSIHAKADARPNEGRLRRLRCAQIHL